MIIPSSGPRLEVGPEQSPGAPLEERLLARCADLWWRSDSGTPPLGPTYTIREQLAREAHLQHFLATLTSEAEDPPRSEEQRRALRERLFQAFSSFARSALDWEERHLELFARQGLMEIGVAFAQAARRFDPKVSGADIFQASRNVWTMNGLQLLLGLPVRLTPAVFAYSMLYPYTDNYLDDPGIAVEDKVAFSERFGRRLAGEPTPAVDLREQMVYTLVEMIEGQFDRSQHPELFASLLAIHRAQQQSVRLLQGRASPYEVDVLGISLAKGGASVLADGYLVAGTLTPEQAAFMFGWGAFLQFVDDLQDVSQDKEDGLLTVFSATAGGWKLDTLTNRVLHFGAEVLERLACFDAPGSAPLKELMHRTAQLLIIDGVGRAGRYFSGRYRRELEAHFPFRFAGLRRQRRRFERQRVELMSLLAAFAAPEAAPPAEAH